MIDFLFYVAREIAGIFYIHKIYKIVFGYISVLYGVNKMKIRTFFSNNRTIPVKYTCDGEDVSPGIEVSEIPSGTASLAIVVEDPDAPSGTWVHWLVWNIPVSEDFVRIEEDSVPGVLGINDFGKLEYGGPCPPSGIHRYFFKVYALDSELDLEEGSSKEDLESAIEGHLLGDVEVIGKYCRK